MTPSEPPVAAQIAPAEQTNDTIEVVAKRADGTREIDRRIFKVGNDAHTAQKDAIQLLRGLPAITIGPEDRILILGSALSQLYVDGRPYLGDPGQFLRTTRGSDIERIELITNPSARFSSESGSGIINVVLRRRTDEGLSGNLSLQETTYAYGVLDTTLNYKRHDWSYQVKASANVGAMARRKYLVTRGVRRDDGAAATVNHERGRYTYDGTDGRLTGKVSYDLDSKTRLAAQVTGGGGHDVATDKVRYTAGTSDFIPYSEHRRLDSDASYLNGEVSIEHRGQREGEILNSSLQFYRNPSLRNVTVSRASNGRQYHYSQSKPTTSTDVKTDWTRPASPGLILSVGFSLHIDGTRQQYAFQSNDKSFFGDDVTDGYRARSSTTAAYTTIQQSLGKLTVSPGLRFESNTRDISRTPEGSIHLKREKIFPSAHASYKPSKVIGFTASYSKRIDRVPLDYLAPFSAVEDVYSIFEGNPNLKDQQIDAYEFSVQLHRKRFEATATAYRRLTRRLWSKRYAINASGANVYTYVNAGESVSSGAQLDISTPLAPQIKVQASVSLFDEKTPVDTGSGLEQRSYFRFSTNGTLEWAGKDRDSRPGDVAQLQWSYNSASRAYQIRTSPWFDVSLSYTRNVTPTISINAIYRYVSSEKERLSAPLLAEISSRKRVPEFQLKLLKTF